MYGLNIDPANPHGNPLANELKDIGVQTVRYTYKDNQPGELSQSSLNLYTNKLNELQSVGIKSLIILSYETYPNKPAFTASDSEWLSYIDAYTLRCSQIAKLLISFNPAYQIWNEPDLPPVPGYDPSLREFVYGSMLWRSKEAIESNVGKDTQIVGAGLASGDAQWWRRVVNSVPGKALLDTNAIHPYGQRPEPNWPSSTWGFGYVGDLIRRYQQEFDGFWWVTESGVKDVSDEVQAEYLKRMYRTIKDNYSTSGLHNPNGGVKQVSWFCWSDGMVTPYGLVRGDSSRKPAYEAFREMAGK